MYFNTKNANNLSHFPFFLNGANGKNFIEHLLLLRVDYSAIYSNFNAVPNGRSRVALFPKIRS